MVGLKRLIGNKKEENIPLSIRPLFLDEIVLMQKYAIASWSYDKISKYEPISFLFVAPSGHGKSEILKVFTDIFITPKVLWKQELTTIDIFRDIYWTYQKEDKRLLYIEDLNRILSKSKTTVNQLFSVLLLVIQKKGLTDVVTDSGRKAELNPPLNMSLIGSLTNDVFDENYLHWFRMGLIDRLLIPTWILTDYQEENIMICIDNSFVDEKENYTPSILDYGSNVKIKIDKELLKPLKKEAYEISYNYFNHYRYLKNRFGEQYRRLKEKESNEREDKRIMNYYRGNFKPTRLRKYKKLVLLTIGKVISEHRKEITKEDVDFICKLSQKYFKLKYNEISGVMVSEDSTYER